MATASTEEVATQNDSTTVFNKVYLSCEDVGMERNVSLGFSFAATIFLCYVVISLLVYAYKKKILFGWKGQRSYDSTKDSSRRDNFITSNVIILQGIISLVYVCSEIQLIEPPRDVDCTTYYYVNLFSFAFALYCAYFLLWFRIYRTFYKNKLIQQSLNKCFYCVHILILLLITLLSVVLPLLSLLVLSGLSYVSVGCGCVARNINGGFQLPRLFVISGFLSFLSHLIFIFFFVYPLCLHKSHIVKMGLNQRKYRYVIKRVAVAGGICAATDLVSFILAMIFPSPTVYFPHFLYSCNLVVNLIGILMTFTNWRDRLFPYNIVK